jgi:flavin reductase (DIM6/NTAB) family NADH-FMN oxidoreductase RutF
MLLLQVDTITMRSDILTVPPPSPSPSRKIVALVDAEKLAPLVSLGQGRYVAMDRLYALMRPSETETGEWISDDLQVKENSTTLNSDKESSTNSDSISDLPNFIEWTTSEPCPLGFDPIKAIVIPRPIGWISTYHNEIAHVAPYSFFMDVCHADGTEGSCPMVAFAAYRPSVLKDVQLDVLDTKCFGVSTVTPELTVAMNLSSAPIPREESEFELAGLQVIPGKCIRAPLVEGSPLTMECEHVKTVDVGSFSVIIGKVVAVRVLETVLTATGHVDATKLRSVTRLGYVDEYAIIDQPIGGVGGTKLA